MQLPPSFIPWSSLHIDHVPHSLMPRVIQPSEPSATVPFYGEGHAARFSLLLLFQVQDLRDHSARYSEMCAGFKLEQSLILLVESHFKNCVGTIQCSHNPTVGGMERHYSGVESPGCPQLRKPCLRGILTLGLGVCSSSRQDGGSGRWSMAICLESPWALGGFL